MEENFVRLDVFCDSVRDGTHDTPKPELEGKYLVTSRAIKNNSIYFNDCYFISQKDFDKINKRSLVEKWDVLMTMIGTVGRLLLVKENPDYAIKNIALFKIGNETKAKWLYYYLNMESVQKYFEMIANGTSQHFIGLGHMRKLKIPNISHKSDKIISILSFYDSLIENNTKRIRLLEQMAENLYKEWFVRFRFPGHENTEFVDGLPKGWAIKKIKDCYNTCSGGTPNREKAEYYINGNIPWIKTGEIQDSIILDTEEKITSDALKHSSAKLLPQNSLLMAMYGVNIGKLGILTKQMSCNQAACAFLPNDENNTFYYLFFYLKSIREYLLNIGFGAAQQNLSQTLIKNIRIILPSKDIINCFEQKINRLYKQIEILQRQSALLTRQRDLLLPRLMCGKLEVKTI